MIKEDEDKWLRCKNDIIYFVEKYCKLITSEGIEHIKLRDYQKKYLNYLFQKKMQSASHKKLNLN